MRESIVEVDVEDWEEDERYYGEAFKLFKEEIEKEDKVEDIDSDNLRV